VPGAPFATPRFGEKYLLADRQEKFLYFSPPSASDPAEANLVSGMSIDAATGTLTALPPFSGLSTSNSFLTQPQWDQSGDYFLMGDTRGSFLTVLPALHVMRVNRTTGVLSPINGSPFTTDAAVVGAQDPAPFVSRSGPWIYRAQGDFWMQTYGLDPAAGTLQFTAKIYAPLTAYRTELMGRILASTTDGKLLFASNGQRIFSLRADPADGRLSIINSILPDPAQGCGVAAFHIHPNGRRVFVLMSGGIDERALPTVVPCPSRVQLYRLDPATGELVLLDSKAATANATIIGPNSAMHPGGQYLYFHAQTDVSYITMLDGIRYDALTDTISLLGIVQAYPFAYPSSIGSVNFLQMDPSGKFLFLGTGTGVMTFRIDASTGRFLALPTFAGSPRTLHGVIVGRQ